MNESVGLIFKPVSPRSEQLPVAEPAQGRLNEVTGVLSPFPIFGGVLAIFAHRHLGAADAQQVLRSVLTASVAFASFFLIVSAMLPRFGISITYAAATIVSVAVNLALFKLQRAKMNQARRILPNEQC